MRTNHFRRAFFLALSVLFLLAGASKPVHADISSGMVGYWNLDEGSGTNAADSSGSNNPGTLVGGPSWAAGKIGSGSVQFSGSNYIDLAGSASSLSLNGALTISFWIKPATMAGGSQVIFAKESTNSAPGASQYTAYLNTYGGEGNMNFEVSNGTAKLTVSSANNSLAVGSWYHVAAVYNGSSQVCLYINGSSAGCQTSAGFGALNTNLSNTPKIATNAYFPGQFFTGSLDDLRIYNRALSSSDVSELYAYAGGSSGGTVTPPPSDPTPPVSDTTAPAISSVASGSVTSSGATVSWSTNESSDSQIEYGLTTGYGNSTSVDASLVTFHSVSLSSLSANTLYHYRVKSKDASGNLATGNDNTFTTSAAVTPPVSSGPNIYISQSGTGDGSSCSSAKPVSFFNSSSNWGSGASQIGPGDTVHLCGTISSTLTVQGSGTSGNPITILFENGAKMSAPTWTGDIIDVVNVSYIIIDGGANGIIEATNNGTALSNKNTITAVNICNSQHSEVKNLTIRNLYVRTQNSTDTGDASGIVVDYTNSNGASNFTSIHNNNISWAGTGIFWLFDNGQNASIYSNTIRYISTGIILGSKNTSATFANADIFNNDISDAYPWDQPDDAFHHDGVHIWGYGPAITGLKIHGNYIHGNWGANVTAQLYFEGNVSGYLAYDNILSAPFRHIYTKVTGPGYIYNNTIYGSGFALDSLTGDVVSFKNNILYQTDDTGFNGNAGTNPQIADSNNLRTDPLFVNASSGDFHLQSGSAAINAGVSQSSYFTADKDGLSRPQGSAWDIGAYEYAGSGGGSTGGTLGTDIYIAQSQAGTADASSCANAKAVSFFNSSSNWGSGASQIGPGETVHLCGTISTTLAVQGSGTSGNPITILFENGAKLSKAAWGTDDSSAIYSAGKSNIVIDGNGTGIIENTSNGDQLSTKQASYGIYVTNCSAYEIKDLTIRNMFIHTYNVNNAVSPYSTRAMHIENCSNLQVHGNTMTHAYVAIYDIANGSAVANENIYDNVIANASTAIIPALGGSASDSMTNINIYGNDITMGRNWFDTPDANHIDGIHSWTSSGSMSNLRIYDNYIHGDPSTNSTGYIYLTDNLSSSYVYNNVLVGSGVHPAEGYINYNVSGTANAYIFNNTIQGIANNNTGGSAIAFDPSRAGTTAHVKNNIISNCYVGIYDDNGNTTWDSDYNLFYNCTNAGIVRSSWKATLSDWKAATGGDAHSLSANPLLTGTFGIPTNSPAANAGANLSSYFTADKNGTARPSTGAWDIGAYEDGSTGGGSAPTGLGPDIYISQSGAGSSDASSCANAKPASFFDSSSNWGSGSSQIGPGETVHLCGTISAPLIVQGSGTSGNPITILFESGAKLSAPAFPSSGAISVNAKSYIVIDGGSNGIIENTANGTQLANHVDSGMVVGTSANNFTVKNLIIRNVYVRTAGAEQFGYGSAITNTGTYANYLVTHNTISNAYIGVDSNYGPGVSNVEWSYNTITHTNWGLRMGDTGSDSTCTDLKVHDNNVSLFSNWDDSLNNSFHHNGFYGWAESGGDLGNVSVYGNTFGPDFGVHSTAGLFMSGHVGSVKAFNNIFLANPADAPSNDFITIGGAAFYGPVAILNNTFIGGDNGRAIGIGPNGNGWTVKNNIFYDVNTPVRVISGAAGAISIDYNLFYSLLPGQEFYDDGFDTPSQWQALGRDLHSVNGDPKFANKTGGDLHLQASSPAINAGASGSAYFTADKDGVSRPQGSAWDIGAYEYSGTPAPPASDTTAPSVSITSPSAGTISGSVSLAASASDNVGVIGVQFKLDGASLGTELNTAPYSGTWNTVGVSNGSHTLTATARDAAGNTKTSNSVTVTVSNSTADTSAPSTPTGITSASLTQTGVTLSWLASVDNVGVSGYKLFRNGVLIASPTANTYAVTGLSANTLYTFTVSAYDAAGNTSSLSLPLSITTASVPVITYTISATKSGTGSGTITGSGVNCGSNCSASVTKGTSITLVATPSSDSTFDGWSGACTDTGICVKSITSNTTVSAVFTLIPVSSGGSSSGSSSSSGGGGGSSSGSSSSGIVTSSPTGTFTPTVPQAPVTSIPVKGTGITLTKNLYRGITDLEVTTLQKYLIAQGYLGGTATGYFGPLTEAGVMRYQAAHGITQTGTIGPITRASLAGGSSAVTIPVTTTTSGSIPAFTRSLTIGATGSDVKNLQIFLNKHGFQVSLSGAGAPGSETTTFGPATTKALAKFQLAKGISPAVGYFGPLTMKAVNSIK